MANYSISVVVPVYGVESYIERCARSLFEQTMQDIEYIFIDDCTPDASVDILKTVLDDYPSRKDHVIIYKMPENSGIAAVRNKGVELSTGEYIIHCDADDWIESDMQESMYKVAKDTGADMVVCDYFEELMGDVTYRKGKSSVDSDMGGDVLLLYASLWNKLVKKEIISDGRIVMPNADCGEDMVLTFQYSQLAKKVVYLNKAFYHYCRRQSSLLGDRSDSAIIQRQHSLNNNFLLLQEWISANGLSHKYDNHITHLALYIKNLLLPVVKNKNNYLSLWRSICSEANMKILSCTLITSRERMNYILTYLGLYPLYKKIIR